MASGLRRVLTLSLNSLYFRSKQLTSRQDLRCISISTSTSRSYFRSFKMSSVFVKSFDNDERLQITLDLMVSNGVTKSINLNRLKSEELGQSLERLRINLSKKLAKKSKQKKKKGAATEDDEEPQMPVSIIQDGMSVASSVSNEKAWVEGAVLKVGEESIPLCCNPPCVKLENLPATMMVGFPLFPQVELEFCAFRDCEFYWKTVEEKLLDKIKSDAAKGVIDLSDAVKAQSYTPQPSDLGKFIILACLPKNGAKTGKLDYTISSVQVTEGPSSCPFETRHEFTREHAPEGNFRVLSYNLLAEIYANTDFAKEHLFNYCPSHALDMGYRKHLLLKEILGYKADLLCLQEVDKSIFLSQLTPALTAEGYQGLFRQKDGQVSEGCATFVRSDKFGIVNELDIVLSEYLAKDPLCADIWTEVCKNEALKEKVAERSSILQVTVVESKENPGNLICLANTHLYFYPTACNVRLIHTGAALRYLQSICDSYTQEGKKMSVVFCGDFNSTPDSGVYQLFTAQWVPSDHVSWSSAGEVEHLSTLELHHPMNIESACGTPEYTNFTQGFKATLDYIFIETDHLEVTTVVPMPDTEVLAANVAIPSVVFPSDHIALICDLKFR